ncbi:MAG: patatin family protein [Candidatus Dadabacteria bacterium]|nr:patatin family protein [Candidatus Dadabacteria bacterium]NIS07940.1 patatin family protein [Candidatus Dadabacteria bacterium]NIY21524.1 patatin family protein [Candidatus Dadabacteria bacterium]
MKLGIALGGGGAKGYAHIGVLKTFNKHGIEFDVISGTSVGAFVGAVYASGSLDKLEEIATRFSIIDIPLLLSPTLSKQGFFSGKKIEKILNEIIPESKIQDLPKPFSAVCVDLNKPRIVTLSKGNLVNAVRASIAIPGLFTPIKSGKQLLVDGGVLEPVPVEAARKMGADILVAVDLLSKSQNFKDLQDGTLVDIIQKTSIATQQGLTKFRMELHPPDFVIEPDVSDLGILDFKKGKKAIRVGEAETKKIIPKIKKLIGN